MKGKENHRYSPERHSPERPSKNYTLIAGKDSEGNDIRVDVTLVNTSNGSVWEFPVYDDDGTPLHTERSRYRPEDLINDEEENSPTFYQVSKEAGRLDTRFAAPTIWRRLSGYSDRPILHLTIEK